MCTSYKSKQINLITAGNQPYNTDLCVANGSKFAYCATLSTYVYEYSKEYNEYNLNSIVCNHSNLITSIVWHPYDDNLIATSSTDNTIILWDLKLQKDVCVLCDVKGTPTYLQWNLYDINTILFVVARKDTFSWNYEKNTVSRFKGDESLFNSQIVKLRFHPKVLKVAFGHDNGTISIVFLNNKKPKKHILKADEDDENPVDPILALEWDVLSNDYLLVASKENGMRLLDTENNTTIVRYQLPSKAVYIRALSWIPDAPGMFITGDSQGGVMRIWNVSKSTPLENFQIKKKGFLCLNVVKSAIKTQIVKYITNEDGLVSQDTEATSTSTNRRSLNDQTHALPRFKLLATFCDGGTGLYDFYKKEWDFYKEQGHLETIFDCKFSNHDSDLVATASFDGTIKLWSISSSEVLDSTPQNAADGIIYSVSWAPGNLNSIVASTGKNGCFIWNWDKKKVVSRFSDGPGPIYCCAWNPKDAKKIASTGNEHCTIRQFDGNNSTIIAKYKHPGTVYSCDWSPSQKEMIATTCEDKKIRVFYLTSTANPLKVFSGHTAKVFSVKWSPLVEGMFCSSSDDMKVFIWDYSKDHYTIILEGHTQPVRALCWNHEIPFILVSGGWDSKIKVWDIRNGQAIDTMNDHVGDIYGLTSHPLKPFLIVSASRDSTIRAWDISSIASSLELRLICKRPWQEIMSTGVTEYELKENSLKIGALPLLVGRCSKELKIDIDITRSNNPYLTALRKFSEFFSPHKNLSNLWDLVDVCNNVDEVLLSDQYYDKIVHWKHICKSVTSFSNHLLMNLMGGNANGILTSQSRLLKLNKVADLYLKSGNIIKYCDIMIELNQWERALAVAPGVSLEYWHTLTKKYMKYLESENQASVLPFAVAIGDHKRIINNFINQGQYKDALTVASAYAESNIETFEEKTKGRVKLKESFVSEEDKVKRSGDVQRVYGEYADWYFSHGDPINAACCHLGISDTQGALMKLIRGNFLELVLHIGLCLLKSDDYVDLAFFYLSKRCESNDSVPTIFEDSQPNPHTYLAIELLNMIQSKELKNRAKWQLCCRVEASVETMDKVYNTCGLPSYNDCIQLCGDLNPNEDLSKFILYHLLTNSLEIAIEIGKKYFKHAIQTDNYTAKDLYSVVNLLNATRTSVLIQPKYSKHKANLMCMSAYVGLLLAINKRYNEIVGLLFTTVKNLLKLEYVDLAISFDLLELEESVWTKVYEGQLNGNEMQLNLNDKATYENLLYKTKCDQALVENLDTGSVLVAGSHLPSSTNKPKSFISGRLIKGPDYLLEDGKSVISLNEAIMWAKCTPFSPLNTGFKINPF